MTVGYGLNYLFLLPRHSIHLFFKKKKKNTPTLVVFVRIFMVINFVIFHKSRPRNGLSMETIERTDELLNALFILQGIRILYSRIRISSYMLYSVIDMLSVRLTGHLSQRCLEYSKMAYPVSKQIVPFRDV